ncbi:MAG TPA: choice-of-anchor J domain-containing protein, partial [Chitinophagaceae bacterium]|nr:choice-of-anchor J domain-containing protein [Chitinophagaceae bacterium]
EPMITVRNAGINTISSLQINYQVNGGMIQFMNWSGTLTAGQEQQLKLPATSFSTGTGSFTVSLATINGATSDDDNSNNQLVTATSIGVGVSLPLTEGFENILFPSVGWSRQTNASPAANWERNTNASRSGSASVYFNNFAQNQPSKYADLKTPLINLDGKDSMELTFYYAAAIFDNDNVDTLEILVSGDCGNSFQTVWRKNAKEIATREGNVNIAFIPTSSEWRKLTVDLNAFSKWNSLIVAFRNINGFGNMIYLDNINIVSADLPSIDLAVASIKEPANYVCSSSIKPVIAFTNLGTDTITNASFMYRINGDVSRSMNWQGKLARNGVAEITMPETILSPGDHSITVWANTTGDSNPSNDSIRISFQVKQQMSLPLQESFETPAFPPAQWNSVNLSGGREWERFSVGAIGGKASAYIHNYENRNKGDKDELVTPLMSYVNADSVFLSFQLSAAGGAAGSISSTTDTLEVFVSTDCGKTLYPVYKKWGKQLQTISDGVVSIVEDFIPASSADWRTEQIDLTSILGMSNSFLTIFSNTSGGVNNIYIDEINVYTRQVPPKLKEKGLLIAPNPFTGTFRIQHYPDAQGLKGVEVFSGTGQRVYVKTASETDVFIEIDLSSKPAGIYFVKLSYKDKVVTHKLLKGY